MLSSKDIALRRQQVREKLALFTLKQEQGNSEAVEEQHVKLEEVVEDVPVFVAFARVFSGTLKRGQEVYVLGPKYDPSTTMDYPIQLGVSLKVSVSRKCNVILHGLTVYERRI